MSMRCKWIVVLALVAISASAMAQSPAAVDQQFAALDRSLSGAADRLLTAVTAQRTQQEVLKPESRSANGPPYSGSQFKQSVRWQELRKQIVPILKTQRLPIEVLAVVKVESNGQLDALSAAGARGLWQLMPDTARRYGLVVTEFKDERLDPVKATWAATSYLHDLYDLFGDWNLTFAAYNAGEEAVSRAIVRSGSREFAELSLKRALPEETRKYVPAVLAQMKLMLDSTTVETQGPQTRQRDSLVYASMAFGE